MIYERTINYITHQGGRHRLSPSRSQSENPSTTRQNDHSRTRAHRRAVRYKCRARDVSGCHRTRSGNTQHIIVCVAVQLDRWNSLVLALPMYLTARAGQASPDGSPLIILTSGSYGRAEGMERRPKIVREGPWPSLDPRDPLFALTTRHTHSRRRLSGK